MARSEDFIENRLKWNAKKNGLPKTNSHFYEELTTAQKAKFQNILTVSNIGKPVIVFIGLNNTWTIFGTIKIISGSDSSFDSIEHMKIDEHTVGDDPMGFFSVPNRNKKFKKFQQDHLLVREKGGRILTLYGPRGEDLCDMHNMLLMLDRIAKK